MGSLSLTDSLNQPSKGSVCLTLEDWALPRASILMLPVLLVCPRGADAGARACKGRSCSRFLAPLAEVTEVHT